jgi:hypothetical protein
MRKYSADAEQNIRMERLVREWKRSGLLESQQCDRILAEIPVDLRRTNLFLRLILFGFTFLLIAASAVLVVIMFRPPSAVAGGVFSLFGAVVTFIAAEILVSEARLYRFGVEEAAAICAALFTGIAALLLFGEHDTTGLAMTAATAFIIYFRFGYVYAAVLAMLCLTAIPFRAFGLSGDEPRLIAALLLAVIWFAARRAGRRHGDDFPADEYALIEAVAWVMLYGFINLHLFSSVFPLGVSRAVTTSNFYSFTYVMTWLLPAIGLWLAIRSKQRLLLDVNLAMALATLATNKPYLHGVQKPWDPILLGLLLIGVVIALRRWLSKDPAGVRNGFTAARLLEADRRSLAAAATASVLFGPKTDTSASSHEETFKPQGGRSGGAGASGSF